MLFGNRKRERRAATGPLGRKTDWKLLGQEETRLITKKVYSVNFGTGCINHRTCGASVRCPLLVCEAYNMLGAPCKARSDIRQMDSDVRYFNDVMRHTTYDLRAAAHDCILTTNTERLTTSKKH